jgi:cellobiose-specific phosphotransferase system component IIC
VMAPNIPSSIAPSFKPLIPPAFIVIFLMWPLIVLVRNE